MICLQNIVFTRLVTNERTEGWTDERSGRKRNVSGQPRLVEA